MLSWKFFKNQLKSTFEEVIHAVKDELCKAHSQFFLDSIIFEKKTTDIYLVASFI